MPKIKKTHYVAHCYACEYRVDDLSIDGVGHKPTPDVIGCLLNKAAPKTCENWRDDEKTARRVKNRLQGQIERQKGKEI